MLNFMARKKKQVARKAKKPTLKVEEVRSAVLVLTELAAAFEGRGREIALRKGEKTDVLEHGGWEPVQEDEVFDEDERCLAAAVEGILGYQRKKRIRQRNAVLEGLVAALSEMYRAYSANQDIDALTLETKIKELCDAVGIRVSDDDLVLIAPERGGLDDDIDGDADSIHALEGPVETAKTVISRLTGLSLGTIADVRRFPHPLASARRPFGRLVARQERQAYAK
jgi:hypothetical protein